MKNIVKMFAMLLALIALTGCSATPTVTVPHTEHSEMTESFVSVDKPDAPLYEDKETSKEDKTPVYHESVNQGNLDGVFGTIGFPVVPNEETHEKPESIPPHREENKPHEEGNKPVQPEWNFDVCSKEPEYGSEDSWDMAKTVSVIHEKEIRPGMIGRLYIDSVGVNIALFHTSKREMVYEKDYAFFDGAELTDMSNDKTERYPDAISFGAMKKVSVGNTAKIYTGAKRPRIFHCVRIVKGMEHLKEAKESGLAMYCYDDNPSSVLISVWEEEHHIPTPEELAQQKWEEKQRKINEKWNKQVREEKKTKHSSSDEIDKLYYGRLVIDELDINVPLYVPQRGKQDKRCAQAIVDRVNAAWYQPRRFRREDIGMIADHNYHGMWKLRNAVPGKTVARIYTGDAVIVMDCKVKGKGKNTGSDMMDSKDSLIQERFVGMTVMYTCEGTAETGFVSPHKGDIVLTAWEERWYQSV